MNRIIITLLLLATSVVAFSQIVTKKKTESDGFQWIEVLNAGSIGINQGARSIDGKDLIPVSKGYKLVYYVYDFQNEGYFVVTTKENCHGIYSKTGQEIIPVSKGYTSVNKDRYGPYYDVYKNDNAGMCDMDGNEIIPISRGYTGVFFNSHPRCKGYFTVSRGDKFGICDMSGTEIIPCLYNSVIFGLDKLGKSHFLYMRNENEFIDLPLTLDENGFAIPYTIEPEQKKSHDEMLENMTPEERDKLMMLLLLLQSKGQI